MSSLFIQLYLDEDVDVVIAALLQAKGYDVLTVRDADRLQETDENQLAYAISHTRAIVTHNRADFEALTQTYFQTGQTHFGIIIAVRRPPQDIAKRLAAILDQVTADEMHNQVRYI